MTTNHTNLHEFLTKTEKTLFEIFGTLCLCYAIVMNLAVSKLPPSSCQYHNISFRYQSFQKEKPRFARKPSLYEQLTSRQVNELTSCHPCFYPFSLPFGRGGGRLCFSRFLLNICEICVRIKSLLCRCCFVNYFLHVVLGAFLLSCEAKLSSARENFCCLVWE